MDPGFCYYSSLEKCGLLKLKGGGGGGGGEEVAGKITYFGLKKRKFFKKRATHPQPNYWGHPWGASLLASVD